MKKLIIFIVSWIAFFLLAIWLPFEVTSNQYTGYILMLFTLLVGSIIGIIFSLKYWSMKDNTVKPIVGILGAITFGILTFLVLRLFFNNHAVLQPTIITGFAFVGMILFGAIYKKVKKEK